MNLRLPTVRESVSAVGAGLLAFAMLVVFLPDLVPDGVLDLAAAVEEAVEPWIVTLVLSLVVFAYALHRFRKSEVSDVERLVESEEGLEAPDFDGTDLEFDPERPGRGFDYAVARSMAQLERDPNADAWEATQVRSTLREAVHAVREGDGRSADDVSAEISDGSWTDDRVAAAFLGGSDAPGVSLWRRLYAWLYPARAFERRLERVVAAIEAQGTVAVGEGEAVDEDDGDDWGMDGGTGGSADGGDDVGGDSNGRGGDDRRVDDADRDGESGGGSGYGRDHGDAVTATRSEGRAADSRKSGSDGSSGDSTGTGVGS